MARFIDALGRASRDALARAETQQAPGARILVIAEHKPEVAVLLTRLTIQGYEAASAPRSLGPAMRLVRSFEPDALLLDTADKCACRELFTIVNSATSAPVIVTGEASEEQQVWYMERGAAEYLAQPVSFALLHAYLRAALRWGRRAPPAGVIRVGGLEIDEASHQVRYRGKPLPVTPTEFRLLRAMAENKGRACSHRMLLERAWGKQFTACTHYLRLYISYLRQKLEEDPANPALIVTEWGIGYRLMEPDGPSTTAGQPVMTVA